MRLVQLKSALSQRILYEGRFPSLIACLETAVAGKIDLTGIDLSRANLANANLDDAQMPGGIFTGCNLSGANLSEANLKGGDFSGTSFYNTCLCLSDMRNCNFEDASFGATDMTGANISGSMFSSLSSFSLDFSGIADMRSCLFKNPCGGECAMSKPPIIIHGVLPSPIIIFDGHVKVGASLRPHEEWFGLVAGRYLKERNLKLAS